MIASAEEVYTLVDQIEQQEAAREHELSVTRQTFTHFRQDVERRGGQQDPGAEAQGAAEQQLLLEMLGARDEAGGRYADDEAAGADQHHRRQLRLDRVGEHRVNFVLILR